MFGFKIGDTVAIITEGYRKATIINFEENMFGFLLIVVNLDGGAKDQVYYPNEIELY